MSSAAICACGSIWSQGPFIRAAGAGVRSRNANSNCIVALLSGGRLGEPAQQSVRDGARREQITDRAKIIIAVFGCTQHFGVPTSHPICPGRGNEGSATVGQHREQQRHAAPLQAANDGKAASFEGMPPAGDDDRSRKVLVMGSLWCLRSGAFPTPT